MHPFHALQNTGKTKSADFLRKRAFLRLFLMPLAAAMVAGCAAGFTPFQRSWDVSVQFEKGEVKPGHRYYVGGPELKPNAIVALRDEYRLEAQHWSEVDVTDDTLRALVDRIAQVDGAEYKKRQMMHNGARIFIPDGQQIGVWYSVYDYSMLKLLDDNVVYLSYPPSRLPPNVRIPGFEKQSPWPR